MQRLSLAKLAFLLPLFSLLGGCAPQDASPVPTDPGRWWYYQTRAQILKEVSEQRLLVTNLGRDENFLRQRRQANWDHRYEFTGEGLLHTQYFNRGEGMGALRESPALLLPKTIAVDEQWTFTSALRLIESRTFAPEDRLAFRPLPITMKATIKALNDTVNVPAGRYRDCIRVEAVGETQVPTDRGTSFAVVRAEQTEWYKPGVGLVRMVRKETSDSRFLDKGQYTQELLETAP